MKKKFYIVPMAEDMLLATTEASMLLSSGSNIEPHAPVRRVTVLGSVGAGSGVGSLGSIGSLK